MQKMSGETPQSEETACSENMEYEGTTILEKYLAVSL